MRYRDFLAEELSDAFDNNTELPKGYQLLGHVALLKIGQDLLPLAHEIGKLTLQYEKRAQSVAVRTGPTKGQQRIPNYTLVAGQKDTKTHYVENDVRFCFDPLQVTFSKGNVHERISFPRRVMSDEYVVDMFSCVGQFALPIAYHAGATVMAIEINKVAYDFLLENIKTNDLGEKVTAIFGDCREVSFKGANRIIMGYFPDTIEYLPHALRGLSRSGGIVHMHELVKLNETSKYRNTIITKSSDYGFSADISVRTIKKYAPRVLHNVFDIVLKP